MTQDFSTEQYIKLHNKLSSIEEELEHTPKTSEYYDRRAELKAEIDELESLLYVMETQEDCLDGTDENNETI